MVNGSVSNCALLISTHRVGELLGVRLGDELAIQVALDPAQRGCGRADRRGSICGAALSHAQQGGGSNSSAGGAVTQFWFRVTQFGWRAREYMKRRLFAERRTFCGAISKFGAVGGAGKAA